MERSLHTYLNLCITKEAQLIVHSREGFIENDNQCHLALGVHLKPLRKFPGT